jgi:type II secretory pathway pseudopilin PulG
MGKLSIVRNFLRDVKGVSLLETLIAIIILTLALTSIGYFFSTARGNIEAFGRMRCGLALAQGKLEELKDLGYSHPDLSVGTHSDLVNAKGEVMGDGQFYREWTVTAPPDNADGIADDDDYKLVQLRAYDQRLSPVEALNDDSKLVAELRTYISP